MTSANQATRIGRAAEVAHVGVERLAAGDGEDDRAEDDEGGAAVAHGRSRRRSAGESARRTSGWRHDEAHAEDARCVTNQTTMIGPKTRPMPAVPRRWMSEQAEQDARR